MFLIYVLTRLHSGSEESVVMIKAVSVRVLFAKIRFLLGFNELWVVCYKLKVEMSYKLKVGMSCKLKFKGLKYLFVFQLSTF